MQVSPSSLDRISWNQIFWKAYGWNCGQKKSFFDFFSQNFFSTSQNEVDFVKIGDFLQSVLWRLHFPVERSAISFFYKPWVILRHRKKIKNFRKKFLTFSAHRNWIYLKISKKRNFENFVNLFEDFQKNIHFFKKNQHIFCLPLRNFYFELKKCLDFFSTKKVSFFFQNFFSDFFLNLAKCDSFCQNQWFFTTCALTAVFSRRTF